MPAAMAPLVGGPAWPDLGLFCGQGMWARHRVLRARAQPLDPGPLADNLMYARICDPPQPNEHRTPRRGSMADGAVPAQGGWLRLDRLLAAQLWAGMVAGMWVAVRRPPLFEALTAAGLFVVTTSSGTTEAWEDVLAQHQSSLGPYPVEALSRRVRYLARAVRQPAAGEIVGLLAADGPQRRSSWSEIGVDSAVVEVFDAGPLVRGGPWR